MLPARARYWVGVKLMRMAALAAIGKKLYDESRKPENQARIRSAVEKVRERRSRP